MRRLAHFLLPFFLAASAGPFAEAALAPSQFDGHVVPLLCNRSMETFIPLLAVEFERTHLDVDFKLDMAVRFPFDRSAIGGDVVEIYDDMSGAKFARKYGREPLTVMISGGGRHLPGKLEAIGVFVHPSNPIRSLTMDQLEQVYGKTPRGGRTRVTTWGQLGLTGEWAARPIIVYGINRFGGAPGGIFNYRVLGTGEPCDESREFMHSPPIVGAVASEPGAIGYIAMAYLDASVKVLPLAPRGESTPVEPTEANVQKLLYPLGIPFYLCVNRPPGQPLDPYVRDFLALVLSPAGQKIIADQGYLPLPPEIVKRELAKLE